MLNTPSARLRNSSALKNAVWAPGAKYRTRFEKDVEGSVRRILIGVTVLTAFELGGERMVVAYETQDQEQEHSCFSDNTWQDFVSNQLGRVVNNGHDSPVVQPGRPDHPYRADHLSIRVHIGADDQRRPRKRKKFVL